MGGLPARLRPSLGVLTVVGVARNQDGRLEIFVRWTDNAAWHKWQTNLGGVWAGWAPLGAGTDQDVAVGSNRDGRLEVFIINVAAR